NRHILTCRSPRQWNDDVRSRHKPHRTTGQMRQPDDRIAIRNNQILRRIGAAECRRLVQLYKMVKVNRGQSKALMRTKMPYRRCQQSSAVGDVYRNNSFAKNKFQYSLWVYTITLT
ncbi:MAG: hypothetical protein RIR95_1108, partial [Pseudomonadota bacterium]